MERLSLLNSSKSRSSYILKHFFDSIKNVFFLLIEISESVLVLIEK